MGESRVYVIEMQDGRTMAVDKDGKPLLAQCVIRPSRAGFSRQRAFFGCGVGEGRVLQMSTFRMEMN